MGQSQADIDEQEWLAKKYELRASKGSSESGESNSRIGQDKASRHTVHTMGEEQQAIQKERGVDRAVRDPEQATEEQLRILNTLRARAAQQSWGVDHPDPLAKNPLPITRAERRKLIKEEIRKLAQADRPVYYQRRLW